MKQIIITGGNGLIGSILTKGLSDYSVISLDRDKCDLTNLSSVLPLILFQTDVLIHLAWDTNPIYENGVFHDDNFLMTHNVFAVAVQKKVKRVILASSVHANEYRSIPPFSTPVGSLHTRSLPTSPSRVIASGAKQSQYKIATSSVTPRNDKLFHLSDQQIGSSEVPTSIYGATKLYFEALGRYYAHQHGLEVVTIRFGGVNVEDSPTSKKEEDYGKIFLSHKDLVAAVKKAIEKKRLKNNYWSYTAVSAN